MPKSTGGRRRQDIINTDPNDATSSHLWAMNVEDRRLHINVNIPDRFGDVAWREMTKQSRG
jgi:hypothetical protein